MTQIFITLLTLVATGLLGQSNLDSSIIGSWKLKGYEIEGRFSKVSSKEIISFYSDSIYQTIRQHHNIDTSNYIAAGVWAIDQEDYMLYYKNYHQIPLNDLLIMGGHDDKIEEITDTLLILSGYEGKKRIYMHYVKINQLPKLADNYLSILSKPDKPEYDFYLVNSYDFTEQILLDREYGISLTLRSVGLDTSIFESQDNRLTGLICNLNDTSISFNIWTERIDYSLINGQASSTYNDYSNSYEQEYRDINIQEISLLNYQSPKRATLNNFSYAINGLSIITTLIVAPLVSINYGTGGFNSDRYFMWAGAGLAGLTIGIPLTIFTKEKKYQIANKASNPDFNQWYLHKKEKKTAPNIK